MWGSIWEWLSKLMSNNNGGGGAGTTGGSQPAVSAINQGAAPASGASGSGGFSGIGDYLKSNQGRGMVADMVQQGQSASATAAGNAGSAMSQGMGAQAAPATATPPLTRSSQMSIGTPGYQTNDLLTRMNAYRNYGFR